MQEREITLLSSDYWCCIITRDGSETIGRTIDSIVGQSIPPEYIVVVNDGSTDNTLEIVKERSRSFPRIFVIDTLSKTRDIRKVPRLLNLGLRFQEESPALKKTKYMMVSGDDNSLTQLYAEQIMRKMDGDDRLVVASGDWISSRGRSGEQMPHGGGRFVKMSFMKELGDRYPVAYGWETWLLYKAIQLGYKVSIFYDVRYEHLRPFRPTNLLGWGRAMYSLGFPFYFVFLRFMINFLWSGRGTQTRKASITMLVGYVSARISPGTLRGLLIDDGPLKMFVSHFCAARLSRLLLH